MSARTILSTSTSVFRTGVARPTVASRGFAVTSVRSADPVKAVKDTLNTVKEAVTGAVTGSEPSPHPEQAPGWKESNASDSEASVKADHHAPTKPDASLQEKTVDHVQKKHGK